MKTFDFENNNPIGYVDILPNGNANIDIVGYVDSLNVFHRLIHYLTEITFLPPTMLMPFCIFCRRWPATL